MLRVRVLEGKGLRAHGLGNCYVAIETTRHKYKTNLSRGHDWNETFTVSVSDNPPLVVKVNKTLHLPGTAVLQGEVPYRSLFPGEPTKYKLQLSAKAALFLELTLQLPDGTLPPMTARRPSMPPPPPPAASTSVEALLSDLPPGVERLPWQVVEACIVNGTKIGEGGFGPVYRSRMPDGREVAIKKRDPDSMQGMKEFGIEVRIVSPLRHPAIVKLLAVSLEGRNLALVYPFFKRGTLESILGDSSVTWETRLHIARDLAEGVGVLHALVPPILHRDISPDNVLLADDLRAKLTDFGTARECPELITEEVVRDEPRGKWHYMAPEVREEGVWSTGADVYAVGVVLLQLLVGLRDPTLQGTPLTALSLQEMPVITTWPEAVRRVFFDLIKQCFAPRRSRIGGWKLAAEIQELLGSALLQECRRSTSLNGAPKDCIWCELEPRCVRFACGHCVMCEDCTKRLAAESGICPVCRAKVDSWLVISGTATNRTYERL